MRRLRNSTVVWSWAFNFLRLATGLVLLPLLLHKLSSEELGMCYVLLSLVALAPVVDFGFNPTIVRFVSYGIGGPKPFKPTASPGRKRPGRITNCSGDFSSLRACSTVTSRWRFWFWWARGARISSNCDP